MISKIFGELKETEYDSDWLESQPIEIPYFNNKKLVVELVEKSEEFIENAEIAFLNFLRLNSDDRENDSELVFKYYDEVLKAGYTEKLALSAKEDIWNFVNAGSITILNWSEDGTIYLCVSCGCNWETEHGLQLSFRNGEKLVKANSHGDDFEEE